MNGPGFKSFLADAFTCPILVPLVPPYGISGDICSRFQSQSEFALLHCGSKCKVYSLKSTSDATHHRPFDSQHCLTAI